MTERLNESRKNDSYHRGRLQCIVDRVCPALKGDISPYNGEEPKSVKSTFDNLTPTENFRLSPRHGQLTEQSLSSLRANGAIKTFPPGFDVFAVV